MCGPAAGSPGDLAWSDEVGASIQVRREDANKVALQIAGLIKRASIVVDGSPPHSRTIGLGRLLAQLEPQGAKDNLHFCNED